MASNEQLSQFPPTHIVLGGMDPLRDDGMMLVDRLVRAGASVRVTEIEMMPHGFLNYKMPFGQGMKEAEAAIDKTTEILSTFLAPIQE